MRPYKLGVLLGVVIVALSIGTTVASAANPAFLGEKVIGLTFKGESTKSKFISLAPHIECTKDKVTNGEVTGEKTLKSTLAFEGCKEGGKAVNSLGDAKEVILAAVSGELCYISEAKKEVGVYFKISNEEIHVEIPTTKELDLYKGTFIGEAENVNISQALQDIRVPEKAIEHCGPKGEKSASLSVSINGAKPVIATLESFEELHFEKAIEIMA